MGAPQPVAVRERRSSLPRDIACAILDGFDRHYRLFRGAAVEAKALFERGDWPRMRALAVERIQMYDRRVDESVRSLVDRFPEAEVDEALWPAIKLAYIGLLHEHRQPECAETFYNSVACRVLDRFQLIRVPMDVYQISHLPFTVLPRDLIIVIGAAVAICLIATIYPSRQAAKLDPVQALRYE